VTAVSSAADPAGRRRFCAASARRCC